VGEEADQLGEKGKSRLMGKDVQPLQSVKTIIIAVLTDPSDLDSLWNNDK
jgi:hypothetical protein